MHPTARISALVMASAATLIAGCGHDAAPLAAPDLVAVGSSASTVSLAWRPVAGAQTYEIERRSGSAPFASVATLDARATRFLDDGLASRTSYTYRLAARAARREGASEQVVATLAEGAQLTPVGAGLGDGTVATLGPAGGRLQTPDGSVTVEVPAGALAKPAELHLRAITNTAPDGQDDALQLTVGSPLAKPLALHLAYAAALAGQADGLGAAVQRGDGSWLSLPVQRIDLARRVLSVQLDADAMAPGSAARIDTSALSGTATRLEFRVAKYLDLILTPRSKTLAAGVSQPLAVVGHTTLPRPMVCRGAGDARACVPRPLLPARELPLNDSPGTTQRWQAGVQDGGSEMVGTVRATAAARATYTAPASAPLPNVVPVTFRSVDDRSGNTLSLSTAITIAEPGWQGWFRGTLAAAAGGDLAFVIEGKARLKPDPDAPGARYVFDGQQTVNVVQIHCTASVAPASQPLPEGTLLIDTHSSPPRYTLEAGRLWNATVTGRCGDSGSASVPMRVPGLLQTGGTLSADGSTIRGSLNLGDLRWEWHFTRQL